MTEPTYVCRVVAALALSSGFAGSTLSDRVWAHEAESGLPGDAAKVSRTVQITMLDNAYEPKSLSVKAGETVRFVVRNEGELVHEFNVGTAEMHAAHQVEMMAMVEAGMLEADRLNMDAMQHGEAGHMMHDDPNAVLLEPGGSGEVIWTFPEHGEIEFACNVPGHYEAGMHGPVTIVAE